MAYISQYQYYENNGNEPQDANWGSYQYISLADIVNNFLLMYAGNHSLVNNEERYKVLFHAKRAIQELNYDAFKEVKVLELSVVDSLRFVLPSDYVNWVRISMYKNGWLRPLTENIQTLSSNAYGSVFYIATGFHGLHVTGGLIAFLIVMVRVAKARRFTHQQATTAIVVSYYWHFVDIVWIALFSAIYLIK